MSLLQLPDLLDVAWARLLEGAGEGGSYAYQIDASGLSVRNRMMYRLLIPNTGSPSVKTRLRLKSTLQASNPAFEGIAVRHRGYKLTGAVPSKTDTRVWDSDPATKGKRAWYSQQSGTYTDAVFIEPVPNDLGIDYITFELIVRASSGQVTISSAECRNHYEISYPLVDISGFQLWTDGFSIDTVVSGIGSDDDARRWIRYIKTEQTSIRKGQLITVFIRGAITGRAIGSYTAGGSARVPADVGLMLKYRRTNDPNVYDYLTVVSKSVNVDNKTIVADGSVQFKALYDYTQTEVLPFVEPTNYQTYDTISVDTLGIQEIKLDMTVADYIGPSQ